MRTATALAMALTMSVAGCSAGEKANDQPLVIATTSVWGDLVGRVVGDNAMVEVLIPRGADPHDFQPSSRQVARLRDAAVVVANGLDLEEGLTGILEAAQDDGVTVVSMADAITPRLLTDSDRPDPHFWTDPELVAASLGGLVDALSDAGIGPQAAWTVAAATLEADLFELDDTLSSQAGTLPADRRQLVTTHDSLGYFAAAYGFDVIGVAVPGGSTLASPSAAALSDLVDAIEESGAPAIFVDAGQFRSLAESLAASTDANIVAVVVATLGEPGSATEDYFSMMLRLGDQIAEALS